MLKFNEAKFLNDHFEQKIIPIEICGYALFINDKPVCQWRNPGYIASSENAVKTMIDLLFKEDYVDEYLKSFPEYQELLKNRKEFSQNPESDQTKMDRKKNDEKIVCFQLASRTDTMKEYRQWLARMFENGTFKIKKVSANFSAIE
jgi:hypothetical protein